MGISMNRQPPNYRQTTANAVNRQTANRLCIKGGGGGGSGSGDNRQPALPGVLDFTQPIECRGRDLASVLEQAKAAGYHAHRMTVMKDVVYQLRFWRNQNACETQPCHPPKKL
jgi:hypothetical protein